MNELVPAYIASNEMEAEVIKNLLINMGISADVFADDSGGMLPNLQLSQGVAVVVDVSDKAEAEQVLERYKKGELRLNENEAE